MVGMTVQRPKVIFEFIKGEGTQKYHWRARSCNGRIICHSENMLHKGAPIRTVENFIEAIKLGHYEIGSYAK